MSERFDPKKGFTRIVDRELILTTIETVIGITSTAIVACLATDNYDALQTIYDSVDKYSLVRFIISFMYNFLQSTTEAGIHPTITLTALGLLSVGTTIDGAHRVQRNMSPKMSWNQKD
jgi:hypothetical protein